MSVFRSSLAAVAIMTSLPCMAIAADSAVGNTSSYGLKSSRSGSLSDTVGLGIMAGEPTGASLKVWTGSLNAAQFGLAYSFNDYAALTGDYLWHFYGKNIVRGSGERVLLSPYVGVGMLLAVSTDSTRASNGGPFTPSDPDDVGAAIRVPLGAEFLIGSAPIGLSVEIVPAVAIAPATNLILEGDLALRVYL